MTKRNGTTCVSRVRRADIRRASFICPSTSLTEEYIRKAREDFFATNRSLASRHADHAAAVETLHRASADVAGAGRDDPLVVHRHTSDLNNLEAIYGFGGVKSAVCAADNYKRILEGHRRRVQGESSADARLAAAADASGGIPGPPESAGSSRGALHDGRLSPLKAILKAGTAHMAAARTARVKNFAAAPMQLRGPSQAAGGRLVQHGVVPTLGGALGTEDQDVSLSARARPMGAGDLAALFTSEYGAGDERLHEVVKGVMVAHALTGAVVCVGATPVDDLMVLFSTGLEDAGINRLGHRAALAAFLHACRRGCQD